MQNQRDITIDYTGKGKVLYGANHPNAAVSKEIEDLIIEDIKTRVGH